MPQDREEMVASRRVPFHSQRPRSTLTNKPRGGLVTRHDERNKKYGSLIRSCGSFCVLLVAGMFIGNAFYGFIAHSNNSSQDLVSKNAYDSNSSIGKFENIRKNEGNKNGNGGSTKQQVHLEELGAAGKDGTLSRLSMNRRPPIRGGDDDDDDVSNNKSNNNIPNSARNSPKTNNSHKQQDPAVKPNDPVASKSLRLPLKNNSGRLDAHTNESKQPKNSKANSQKNTKGNSTVVKEQSQIPAPVALYDFLKHPNMTQEELIKGLDMLRQQSITTATTPSVMLTKKLPDHEKKRILVTGGAGFVGSHLVDRLMMEGHEVIVMDNFYTGHRKNVEHWTYHPNFSLIVHDVTDPILLEVDQIYHLACPASPPHYQYNPVKTIKTSTQGTLNMLGLAKRVKARMLLASTSEIYGDPTEHPQPESYWGNVNTIGPRSCYDEGKRVAETMMYAYRDQSNVDVRVARIFNTFGPRMHPNDGRVVSNFIIQALQGLDLTIYGNGEQSRSFQFVSDLVEGLYVLMNGTYDLPVNLGNPSEYTVKRFAEHIKNFTSSQSQITFLEASKDDPHQRRPLITTAKDKLGWEPKVSVDDGLNQTIKYFERVLKDQGEILPTGPGASKPKV